MNTIPGRSALAIGSSSASARPPPPRLTNSGATRPRRAPPWFEVRTDRRPLLPLNGIAEDRAGEEQVLRVASVDVGKRPHIVGSNYRDRSCRSRAPPLPRCRPPAICVLIAVWRRFQDEPRVCRSHWPRLAHS
jgi:hypothetical protein